MSDIGPLLMCSTCVCGYNDMLTDITLFNYTKQLQTSKDYTHRKNRSCHSHYQQIAHKVRSNWSKGQKNTHGSDKKNHRR